MHLVVRTAGSVKHSGSTAILNVPLLYFAIALVARLERPSFQSACFYGIDEARHCVELAYLQKLEQSWYLHMRLFDASARFSSTHRRTTRIATRFAGVGNKVEIGLAT